MIFINSLDNYDVFGLRAPLRNIAMCCLREVFSKTIKIAKFKNVELSM